MKVTQWTYIENFMENLSSKCGYKPGAGPCECWLLGCQELQTPPYNHTLLVWAWSLYEVAPSGKADSLKTEHQNHHYHSYKNVSVNTVIKKR